MTEARRSFVAAALAGSLAPGFMALALPSGASAASAEGVPEAKRTRSAL